MTSQEDNEKKVEELKRRKRSHRTEHHVTVTKESPSKQFLPEIEIDLKTLPSRGVPYPENAKLSYLSYTFGEVKKASISNMGIPQSLKLALSGIKTEGFDKQQLTIIDCLYIGLMRKISSMNGMEIDIPYLCHSCGQRNKARFKHTDIVFSDLADEISELPIEGDIDGVTYEFSPMTVKQYLDLHSGRYQKVLKEGKVDSIAIYASQVKNFDFEETYEKFYNLRSPDDIEVLQRVDEMLHHDIKPLVATCTALVNKADSVGETEKCGAKNLVKLEGREALLLPFRDGEEVIRDRVRIRTAPKSECVSD